MNPMEQNPPPEAHIPFSSACVKIAKLIIMLATGFAHWDRPCRAGRLVEVQGVIKNELDPSLEISLRSSLRVALPAPI